MLKRTVAMTLLVMVMSMVHLILPGVAAPKPLVHWDFNRLNNMHLDDAAGKNNGAMIGDVDDDTICPGLHGDAIYFDNGKRYIKLDSTAALSLTDNFTVEYVIKPEAVDGYRTIFWKGDRSVTPEQINYYFDIRSGKPEMKFKDAEGRWIVYSSLEALMTPDNWYHVIFTYQSGNVELYVNGEKIRTNRSENGQGQKLLPNKGHVFIGVGASAPNPLNYFYDGLIDDIKIYQGRVVNIPQNYTAERQQLLSQYDKRLKDFQILQQQRAEAKKEKLANDYLALYKRQSSRKDAPFAVTVLSTVKRLVKETGFFEKLGQLSKVATISAARNEYEGFNIIVLGNPSRDTNINNVTVSDLVSADGALRIAAKNITCGYVKDITSEKPSIPVRFVGAFPDVIMNGQTAFQVKKGSFTPVFINVYTGDARPGEYTGTVTLVGENYTEKVPVHLRVYDFTLPQKGSLRTAFSFFEQYYKKWYGLKEIPEEKKRTIYDFLLSYRLSPNNIYSSASIHPDLKSLEEMKDRTNFFTIQHYGNSKPVSPETLKKQVDAVGAAIAQVKQAGLQDDMYYYSYDEFGFNFTPTRLAAVKQINSALMKAYPQLRLMQTSVPDPRFEDAFNVWAPLFHEFASEKNLETFDRLRKRGDEIWWYSADGPIHPYPNFFLDYPLLNERIISTLSYMYHVDGVLYWSINREWLTNMDIRDNWPDEGWKPYIFSVNTGERKSRNGMGNFVYPGKDGKLLPSLRLENLRDGLEDYEYLKELGKAVQKLKAANVKDKDTLLKEAEALLTVPTNVAVSVNNWSADPDHLLQYRNHVGEVVSRINEKLE